MDRLIQRGSCVVTSVENLCVELSMCFESILPQCSRDFTMKKKILESPLTLLRFMKGFFFFKSCYSFKILIVIFIFNRNLHDF